MGITFTRAAAEKIQRATRMVLANPRQFAGERNPAQHPENSFWGLIIGTDITGLRYTVMRVIPDANADKADFVITDKLAYRIAGSEPQVGFAREASGNKGVPTNASTVVKCEFIGYDADDQPAFLFQYVAPPKQAPLRPHDHRDNMQQNGGFAFSVYHPGTSLPQAPFHV